MKRQRHAAVGTIARLAAVAAKERCGKPATVEKQDGLLVFLQANRDRGAQFLREDRGGLFFPALLAKIDNAHERHLLLVNALG